MTWYDTTLLPQSLPGSTWFHNTRERQIPSAHNYRIGCLVLHYGVQVLCTPPLSNLGEWMISQEPRKYMGMLPRSQPSTLASSIYSGFWDVLPFPASTSSSGTLSYLLPSLSPDLGACDSLCLIQVYQMDPPRIIAIEDARPLFSIGSAEKRASEKRHLQGDHIAK